MESLFIADTLTTDREYVQSQYLNLLRIALNSWLGDEVGEKRFVSAREFLLNTDFFTAPASTKYHEVFEGGLCTHTLSVSNNVLHLLPSYRFARARGEGVNPEQAVICALLHDWCKIGLYEPYKRNVKNDETGKWTQVDAYRVKEDKALQLGHGEESAIMALRLIPELTDEMLMAIRWHMGPWDCSSSGTNSLGKAAAKYPLVYLVQFADLLSIAEF